MIYNFKLWLYNYLKKEFQKPKTDWYPTEAYITLTYNREGYILGMLCHEPIGLAFSLNNYKLHNPVNLFSNGNKTTKLENDNP